MLMSCSGPGELHSPAACALQSLASEFPSMFGTSACFRRPSWNFCRPHHTLFFGSPNLSCQGFSTEPISRSCKPGLLFAHGGFGSWKPESAAITALDGPNASDFTTAQGLSLHPCLRLENDVGPAAAPATEGPIPCQLDCPRLKQRVPGRGYPFKLLCKGHSVL